MDKPQIIAHVEKSLNFTLYDAKWIPCSAKCVVLGSHPRDTGAFHIYELSKGELKSIKEVRCQSRDLYSRSLFFSLRKSIPLSAGRSVGPVCISVTWQLGTLLAFSKYGQYSAH